MREVTLSIIQAIKEQQFPMFEVFPTAFDSIFIGSIAISLFW